MHAISESLHEAYERRDLNRLLDIYDDEAELVLIDRNHPPSHPHRMTGKDAIAAYYEDIFRRPLVHHVQDEVLAEDRYAYAESCEYPDGSQVYTSVMATLKDGRIVREVDVQAWDEQK